ncbi:MAG: multicopper oxidase family protein, partial [Deltaproteobacteria bacterium]|nr:multicopper oxidase family protein [Deltaproteobacteria bacterium]
MAIDRRTFLKTTLGSILAAGIPTYSFASTTSQPKRAVREFRFSASQAKINLGQGPSFIAWTFNGQVPGPEIRVKEGEIIRVVLKNFLPEGTTIHWHGVPVPNAMDGVPEVTQKPVMPGQTFVYEFEARPAGSYIYHSHFRYQLDQGLYGPLIIEPSRDQKLFDQEYTLTLEDWVMKDGGGAALTARRPAMGGMMRGRMGMTRGLGSGRGPLAEPVYDSYAVNGRIYPEITPLMVKKGGRVKLRILNASSSTIYALSLAGHSLKITHLDGAPITPVETDVLRIGMGERYDAEFLANNPGRWLLAAYDSGLGEGMLRIPVQYIGVERKEAVPPVFHREMRMETYGSLQSLHPLKELPRPIERFYPQTLSGGMHSSFWTINGQVYPNTENLVVKEGDWVRFRYWNRSMMPHPMHLHGHFFRVVNPSLPRERWIVKDTVVVDPMQQMEIEFLANNPGNWFHHCHNLYHMEAGMA